MASLSDEVTIYQPTMGRVLTYDTDAGFWMSRPCGDRPDATMPPRIRIARDHPRLHPASRRARGRNPTQGVRDSGFDTCGICPRSTDTPDIDSSSCFICPADLVMGDVQSQTVGPSSSTGDGYQRLAHGFWVPPIGSGNLSMSLLENEVTPTESEWIRYFEPEHGRALTYTDRVWYVEPCPEASRSASPVRAPTPAPPPQTPPLQHDPVACEFCHLNYGGYIANRGLLSAIRERLLRGLRLLRRS